MLRQIHKVYRRLRQPDRLCRTQDNHQARPDGQQLDLGVRQQAEPRLLRESRAAVRTLHAQEHREDQVEGRADQPRVPEAGAILVPDPTSHLERAALARTRRETPQVPSA